MRNLLLSGATVLALSTGAAQACSFDPPDPFGQYDVFNGTTNPKIFESGITCQQAENTLAAHPGGWGVIHSRLFTWQGFDCTAQGSGLPLAWAAVQLLIDGCSKGQMCKIGGNGVCIPFSPY